MTTARIRGSRRSILAQKAWAETVKLADMKSEDFGTIFCVGGHGPMWDLVDNPDSIRLIESFYDSGKPVPAVCHSSAVFHLVMDQGEPLVKGKRVTGFYRCGQRAYRVAGSPEDRVGAGIVTDYRAAQPKTAPPPNEEQPDKTGRGRAVIPPT
jgi:putative intracellular protease/amidase